MAWRKEGVCPHGPPRRHEGAGGRTKTLPRPRQGNRRQYAIGDNSQVAAFGRVKSKVRHRKASAQAHAELVSDDVNGDVGAFFADVAIARPRT